MPFLPLLSTKLPPLDAHLRDRLWRGNTLLASNHSIASGFASLDAQLPGGGWPTRCLNELLIPALGIGEIRLLAPCLATLVQARRQIIVLASSTSEHGLLYPDGWAQLGIDPKAVLLVQSERPADHLWAIEQSLKSAAFGALLTWLPEAKPDALRRLQLAAAGADGLSFFLRPAKVQDQSSPAPLRLLLGRPPSSGTADRLLSVRLIKRRGPLLEQPILLRLPDPRPLRHRTPKGIPTRSGNGASTALPTVLRHALGRPLLSDAASRSHPTPAT
ncbi:MAG: translesion DNA synthesis-associated protein ImuA [Burkholderiaceae bacterium]|jgi:protein ImuA